MLIKKQLYFPIHKPLLYFPIHKPLLCFPIKMDFDINLHYFQIQHLEDFQLIEITNNCNYFIDMFAELQFLILNLFDEVLFKLQVINYKIAHINLKIYFETENFNNGSKNFYYKKIKINKNIDTIIYFLTELNNIIEIYSITQIKQIIIKIIYG